MYLSPGGTPCQTLQEWVAHAQAEAERENVTIKPPTSWLDAQDNKGRDRAKFMIWHHRYAVTKQLVKWVEAPEDDWIAAGYMR